MDNLTMGLIQSPLETCCTLLKCIVLGGGRGKGGQQGKRVGGGGVGGMVRGLPCEPPAQSCPPAALQQAGS